MARGTGSRNEKAGKAAALIALLVAVLLAGTLAIWRIHASLRRASAEDHEQRQLHEKGMSAYEFDSVSGKWLAKCNRFRAQDESYSIDGWSEGGRIDPGGWIDYVLDVRPLAESRRDKPTSVALDVVLLQDGKPISEKHHERSIAALPADWRIEVLDFVGSNEIGLQPGKYALRLAIRVNNSTFNFDGGEILVTKRRRP